MKCGAIKINPGASLALILGTLIGNYWHESLGRDLVNYLNKTRPFPTAYILDCLTLTIVTATQSNSTLK